jgi:ferric-dicitrate binding protein FerR (iron transport regulator)
MSKKDAADLLNRYLTGNVTTDEKALVESWYVNYSKNAQLPDIDDQQLEDSQQDNLLKLLAKIRPRAKHNYFRSLGVAAAVSGFIIVSLTLFKPFIFDKKQTANVKTIRNTPPPLPPGGNKAILILSDGSSIELNDAKKGELANDKGVKINKKANGQISYTRYGVSTEQPVNAFNTVITPRGGQYQLVLSDGTKVWLNSASSLKYPVTFTGNKREIELSGEAYFEVAHNPHKPFRVISNGQIVEVLGTHFNVNAYADEPAIKTTLLEGSVKVQSNGVSKTIKPNEQVQLRNGSMNIVKADVNEATAWKNGFFYFKDDDIKSVLRQLARWYNVDIKYEGEIPQREFSGEISKNIDASKLLAILSFEKITYHIENKTIIIKP